MKRLMIALPVLAVLSVSACAGGGTWTPMSAGRTAGDAVIEQVQVKQVSTKADRTFSHSLRK